MGLRNLPMLVCLMIGLACASCGANSDEQDLARVRAPGFVGADAWLNTDNDTPISIEQLKGRVVLLDFWTYCCINCMHVFPELHALEEKYQGQPVVVIGIHSGKFDHEKDADHIRQAVLRHNITHPVAVDSQYKIWNAYGVQAWPTQVLIDSQGQVVAEWSGEGHREQIDHRISQLLDEGRKNGTLAGPIHFKTERASFKSGTLEFPGKVLSDAASQRLFISDTDHNRVLVSDMGGKVAQVIGGTEAGLKDGPFAEARFHQPQGLALSQDGMTLYIADTENHALRAADLRLHTVTTLAGNGEQGHQILDLAPARQTLLSSPWDLARVGERLYIAMAGLHEIWVMDLPDSKSNGAGNDVHGQPLISIYAGTGREGNRDAPNGSAWFAQPSGLATDGTHLYVADAEASSIRSIALAENQTTTIAGSGDLFGFGRKDGPGRDALFQHPLGVALAGDRLFVADTFNNQIRTVDLKTNTVTTFLGSGASDAGAEPSPNFYEPGGLSICAGILYVADTNHHRIVAVDLAKKKARTLNLQLP